MLDVDGLGHSYSQDWAGPGRTASSDSVGEQQKKCWASLIKFMRRTKSIIDFYALNISNENVFDVSAVAWAAPLPDSLVSKETLGNIFDQSHCQCAGKVSPTLISFINF